MLIEYAVRMSNAPISSEIERSALEKTSSATASGVEGARTPRVGRRFVRLADRFMVLLRARFNASYTIRSGGEHESTTRLGRSRRDGARHAIRRKRTLGFIAVQ